MQIDRFYFPVETLGYGKRMCIWTVGCPHHCYNCSNPELWDCNDDKEISVLTMINAIKPYINKCDGITITGGDPFFQAKDLEYLLYELKSICEGDILVFSGYTFEEILNNSEMNNCLKYIDVLIDGKYIDAMNDNKGLRGSSNQNIHILNKRFQYRYLNAEALERQSQLVVDNGLLMNIGIPMKICE